MSAGLALPKLPDRIMLEPVLSNEEFEELCAVNSPFRLERTREGVIVVNAPAGMATGDGNAEIIYQLRAWWKAHRQGRAYDSNLGVFLPDGSSLAPDAAYVTAEQIQTLRAGDLDHFLPFAPAFVVELLSKTDSVKKTERMMRHWIENGVQVGWMIDPYKRRVTIYESGRETRIETRIVTDDKVVGTGPVAGFVLELADVWRSYELP
jgi:Uma2 family endonuclease